MNATLTSDQQRRRSDQNRFRPDIEGLRAVAVLSVVLFHAQVPGVTGGFVGVDVFFVISGFLITGLLRREAKSSGTVRLRNFYGARARRLLPASATVGVITMIASALLLPPLQVRPAMEDGIASALYVGNYWFIFNFVGYFGGRLPLSPFQHYWSLGVEEQFYLVWPALILVTAWVIRLVRRRNRIEANSSDWPFLVVLALVAVLSFGLSYVATYVSPSEAFFSLHTRAWQLALGGLVALTSGRWRVLPPRAAAIMGWTGLALILLACIWLTDVTTYPGVAALLPTLGAVLVIGAGCALPTQGCGRVLAVLPMQAMGRISYSWYLWHWPVLLLAPALLGHPLGLAARLAAALLSGGLAILTLRFLENPLRFAPKIRNSAWRSLGVGALATAVAACVGLLLLMYVPSSVGRGAPATPMTITAAAVPAGSSVVDYDAAVEHAFAQVQAAVAESADRKAVPSNLDPPLADAAAEQKTMLVDGCLLDGAQDRQPECAAGDTASSTRVVLVGDSHAAAWNPAFEQVAGQRHWRLEKFAKGSCPLMDLPSTNPLGGLVEQTNHCRQWRAQILTRLRAERPQLVVVSMKRAYSERNDRQIGFTPFSPAWLNALSGLVRQLRDTGAQVLVLGPVPNPQSVVPICLSANLEDATACTPTRSTAVNESGIAAEAAATNSAGGQYVDLTQLFCTPSRCPVVVGNTLVYLDWSHITLEYSRLLAPVMGALADRALAHR